MNKIYAALAALAVLSTAGCGGASVATKQSSSPASTTVPVDSTAPAVEESTTPPPDEPGIAKVGPTEWFTYEDGLKVQVTKLSRFKIASYAVGGKPGGTGVIVVVTIRNGSKATFDASGGQITVTSGPNGDAADTVYDTDMGLNGGFEGSIPPGRAKTVKVGFAVPTSHMGQIHVEVQPSYEHNSSFFDGAAK